MTEDSIAHSQELLSLLEQKTGLIVPRSEKWNKFIQTFSKQELLKIEDDLLQDKFSSKYFQANESFWQKLYQFLNISETYFYRDASQLDSVFSDLLLPYIFKESKTQLRIWSAGCSKGEEVYTLAILMQNLKHKHELDLSIEVLGTDLQTSSILFAKQAIYDRYSFRSNLPPYFMKYFIPKGETFHVHPEIQSLVRFEVGNLLDPIAENFDLIFCRNVLIYLSEDKKRILLDNFAKALESSGILVTGHSELGPNLHPKLSTHHIPRKTSYYLRRDTENVSWNPKEPQAKEESFFTGELSLEEQTRGEDPKPRGNTNDTRPKQSMLSQASLEEAQQPYSWEQRLQSFKERIYTDPQDLEAYYEISSLYWQEGERELAKTYQSRARVLVKNNPQLVDIWKESLLWKPEWEEFLNQDL